MLNRDFTNSTLNIIRSTMPKIEAPIQPDWAGIIRQAGKDYQTGKQLQADNALTEQLIAENPEKEAEIRQMGGRAYADMLKADAERAEERQWKLDDIASQRDFKRELLDAQTQRAFALENMRNANARSLKEWELGLKNQAQAEADAQQAEAEAQSQKQAQDAINDLYDVASKGNIGAWTDWRLKHKLTTAETERDLGKRSAAVAGIASRAIAKLKAAGVSGVNSLPEFMTYIGLPENPTSEQIMGALPMMAQIAGVENPIPEKSLKQFNNNSANAPMLDVGATQNFNNGFSVTRVK